MFQFPYLPRHWLCVHQYVTGYHPCWVAPFGFPRLYARPQLPEAFRRVATSFFGANRLGIHRVPSLSFSLSLNLTQVSISPLLPPSPDFSSHEMRESPDTQRVESLIL